MKQIEVQIMGQSYLLGCPEGGETQLRSAVERVDAAMCKIRDAGKVKARDRIAVLASLNLAFDLVQSEAPAGTYHATSSGQCSWFGFARTVVVAAGLASSTVQPTSSEAFVRPAPRPAYSVLGHEALTGLGLSPIGDWEERWAESAPAVLAEHS